MPFFDKLNDNLRRFIGEQKMFFVATAAATGRINLSPKGLDALKIVDDHTVMYLDLTGSGNETAAHIENDGRLTMMLCSFDEGPMILRMYGTGDVVRPRDPRWQDLSSQFPPTPGTRQVIVLTVDSVQTSCGWGVPMYDLVGDRKRLVEHSAKLGEEGLREQWRRSNQTSIDGLPTRLLSD